VLVRESVRQAVFARYKAASEIKTRGLKIQRRGKGVTSTMVKGKRLNIQALLVQAELNVREKGAGFLSISSRFPRGDGGRGEDYSESIFGQRLGAKYLTAMGDSAQARFVWGEEGPLSLSAATGLSKDRARDVVARAIAATRANMLEYTRRKQKEAVEKIGKS
jgi:hypothetical protein